MWAELPILSSRWVLLPLRSVFTRRKPPKKFSMIKIYGMETCPDCTYVEEQVKGNDKYEVIDIGRNVRDLKAFLRLRDSNDAFALAKRVGAVGIPCFVLEDGTVTLTPEEAGLRSRPAVSGAACSIDGERLLMPFACVAQVVAKQAWERSVPILSLGRRAVSFLRQRRCRCGRY